MRPRLELVRLRRLPLDRRTGHRRLLGHRPHVHRRNRARRQTRTPRRTLPVQHRRRNPDGLPLQLLRRHPRLRLRRVALETRCRCPARRALLRHAVRHSAKPTLARPPRPYRGSPRDLHPHRRARPEPRSRRRDPLRGIRRPHEASSRSSSASTGVPIFLAIAIGMFNQFSGINAILYYLNDIFKSAGFDKVSSDLQAVAIGGTNLLFTIDRHERDRSPRPQETAPHRRRRALPSASPASRSSSSPATGEHLLVWLPDRLHRLLRLLARRRHLGLSQRGLSQPGARQRPEPRQLHSLDHERHDRVHLPAAWPPSPARRPSSSSRG